ncbi:ROK family protein [Henriciella sp.]|uniref:ROK family protein n=1 Tax=Henriciella sp. TaxID=1968823 RepID=UPI00262AC852|nr:ROK family protein [Henriciella sp.]
MTGLHGGIDAGGTSFKCGVADAAGRLVATRRVPVSLPEETLEGCTAFFREQGPLQSLGIASFGPVDIDPASPGYGTILKTPKPGWTGTNLRTAFGEQLGLSVHLDTDVNGALRSEMSLGAGKGAASAAYVTIGTGIGAGLFAGGEIVARPLHPEFGHVPVRRHPDDVSFRSNCPFHEDCLEGLASAAAVALRHGDPAMLAEDHPGWEVEADYLAQACRILSLTARLERIILGGGLIQAGHLVTRVRDAYARQMGGYLDETPADVTRLIVPAGLGQDAGLLGAILLGMRAR